MLGGEQRGVNGAPDAFRLLVVFEQRPVAELALLDLLGESVLSNVHGAFGYRGHIAVGHAEFDLFEGLGHFFVGVTDSVDGCMHYGLEPN